MDSQIIEANYHRNDVQDCQRLYWDVLYPIRNPNPFPTPTLTPMAILDNRAVSSYYMSAMKGCSSSSES